MRKLDIVKEAGTLALEQKDKVGECNSECRTVQHACKKAVGGKDSELVSLLVDAAGLAKLHNRFCEKPCKQKSLPQLDKWTNEAFKEDMEEIMESLKGMPGMENMKMYKPGDLEGLAG